MKMQISSAALLVAVVQGAAFAASPSVDEAQPLTALAPPVMTWSGFYLGVNAGYGGGENNYVGTQFIPPTIFSPTIVSALNGTFRVGGALVGGTFGYNWEFANRWVLGAEVDVGWADIRAADSFGAAVVVFPPPFPISAFNATSNVGLDWLGTARLRVGYDFGRFMPFVTGGVAFGGLSSSAASNTLSLLFNPFIANIGLHNGSTTTAGWAVGAGLEYLVTNNLSVKTEYIFTQIGGVTRRGADVFGFGPGVYGSNATSAFSAHIVRAGLNYHVNWFDRTLSSGAEPFLAVAGANASAPMNWSGFYLGANAGYGGGVNLYRANETTPTLFAVILAVSYNGSNRAAGALAGGTIGYNFQLGDHWIVGGEADVGWADIRRRNNDSISTITLPGFPVTVNQARNLTTSVGLDWLGTARLRIGYDLGRIAPYVTAGVAFGGLRHDQADLAIFPFSFNYGASQGATTSAGWAAGAGVEAPLFDRWSVKTEYLYAQLGGVTGSGVILTPWNPGAPITFRSQTTEDFGAHIVRAGLNYHWN